MSAGWSIDSHLVAARAGQRWLVGGTWQWCGWNRVTGWNLCEMAVQPATKQLQVSTATTEEGTDVIIHVFILTGEEWQMLIGWAKRDNLIHLKLILHIYISNVYISCQWSGMKPLACPQQGAKATTRPLQLSVLHKLTSNTLSKQGNKVSLTWTQSCGSGA